MSHRGYRVTDTENRDLGIILPDRATMGTHRHFTALLLCLATTPLATSSAASSPEATARTCSLFSAPESDEHREAVLADIRSSLGLVNDEEQPCTSDSDSTKINDGQQCASESDPTKISSQTTNAIRDFTRETSRDGKAAFLRGLAHSPTFRNEYWHKRPLHIRSSDIFSGDDGTNSMSRNNWISGTFTVGQHLKQIDGSYINGHCTAEILRNGTKTDTWAFRSLKDNPARPTTWAEVEHALQDGTVYFNNAGSLWSNLGGLCRLTGYAFGLPNNVNVYVTPQGCAVSVPPHTDKQDVLCIQTQGAKRWRVYAPPMRKKGVDPMSRGKNGDAIDIDQELGEPLIDAVIRKGDVLYVPQGFPHTTDTVSAAEPNSSNKNAFHDEISVHLTMGLDSNVWFLTYAHLRWALLQRAGKEYRMEIKSDESYWNSMETIPIGFLAGNEWDRTVSNLKETGTLDKEYISRVTQALKEVMMELEPERWGITEEFPSDEEFADVIMYVVRDHAQALMDLQEDMFTDIDPRSDATIMKAYQCTQKQNEIMERFGKFSKNAAMEQSFAQTRAKRDMLAKNNNS